MLNSFLFLPAPNIGSFRASEGPPIQNEQMWAASCFSFFKIGCLISLKWGVDFFHLLTKGWIVVHLCTGRLDATLGSIVLGVGQSRLCVDQRSAGHSEKMNLIICSFGDKQAISLASQRCLTSRSIL